MIIFLFLNLLLGEILPLCGRDSKLTFTLSTLKILPILTKCFCYLQILLFVYILLFIFLQYITDTFSLVLRNWLYFGKNFFWMFHYLWPIPISLSLPWQTKPSKIPLKKGFFLITDFRNWNEFPWLVQFFQDNF